MSIDPKIESLIPLPEVVIPGRNGKRTHIATLYRWISKGSHGVRLEYVVIGGRIFTSEAAIARFMSRRTEAHQLSNGFLSAADTTPTPRERDRQIQAAERRLAAAGA